jgi:predicted nucleic acid-binding protein
MRYYVDTSVALHALLPGGDVRAIAWFESVDEADELFSSALIELEIARVLRRESLDLTDGRAVLDRLNLISVDGFTLRAAAAIEPHVKTLDSIHLATCLQLGEGVTLITHDLTMAQAAETLGVPTHDPVGSQLDAEEPV